MNGWMDEWTNGRTDGRTDGRVDEWMDDKCPGNRKICHFAIQEGFSFFLNYPYLDEVQPSNLIKIDLELSF
jgi:hypothetical protein